MSAKLNSPRPLGPGWRRKLGAIGLVSALGLSLAACSSADDEEIELQFWTWSLKETDPIAQSIIKEYEDANPGITIKLAEVGGTADTSSKLLAADRADDVPDIVQVEYRGLPSLVVAGAVRNITDDIADVRGGIDENIWALSSLNGEVYGVPQDIGPMTITYRADLFEQYGAPEPTTWAKYAEAAQIIHEADPSVYIGSFSAQQFEFFAAHAAQAGGQWWTNDGETWSIGIDDDASMEIADYWQDLVERDLLSVEPLLTPEWNAKVNDDKLLSWTAAAWAPSVIYSVAPDTVAEGNWKSAPLPQWNEGDPSVPFLGGSTYLIPEKSKHAEEAAKFAAWLGASDRGSELLLTMDLYPAGNAGRTAALSNDPPRLMPDQADFYQITDQIISNTTIPMVWGPNVNVAQTALGDALNEAALSGGSFRDVFTRTADNVANDLINSGYSVNN